VHGQRPADVLRVGKINITQAGQNEFNMLQRLDHRPSPAQRSTGIPGTDVVATKTPAPEGREDPTQFDRKANFTVLKSTTQSVDTL